MHQSLLTKNNEVLRAAVYENKARAFVTGHAILQPLYASHELSVKTEERANAHARRH